MDRRRTAAPAPTVRGRRTGEEEGEAPDRAQVIVVGGGLGGLLAAALAAADGARVLLLDAHPLGGRARTDQRGGFTFNRGPRALYRGGPADRLLRSLGVATRTGAKPGLTRAGAILDGRVHRFPTSAAAALRTDLFAGARRRDAARALGALAARTATLPDDLPLAAWLDDRGLTGTPRSFVEALVRVATYADAPDHLPASVGLAAARSASTRGVQYLDGGFQALVDALAGLAAARGVVHVAEAAAAVRRSAHDGWVVETGGGRTWAAPAVVVAVGGPGAVTALVGEDAAALPPLGPAAQVACLELGLRRPPARGFLAGIDEPTYASLHAPPADLAPPGGAVLHVMRSSGRGPRLEPADVAADLRRVAALAGVDAADVVEERFLASMTVTGALPDAALGGLPGRAPVADPSRPGLLLVGDWVGEVGLLLDAVAASAALAARHARQRSATMGAG